MFGLPWPHLVGLLLGAFIFYQAVAGYLRFKRLAHIPGLKLATWTPFWLWYHTLAGDLYLAVHKSIDKYGSPLRVGPNTIAFNDPIVLRTMSAPRAPFVRGHWFSGMKFDPRIDNLLSERNEDRHAEMRRKEIPGYSGTEIPSLEKDVDDRLLELLSMMRDYADKVQQFDFCKIAIYFTLDVLTKIAFGEPLGFLTQNKDLFDYIATSEKFYPVMELCTNSPTVYNILNSPLLAGAQPKPTDQIGFGKILRYGQKTVADRLASKKQKPDMLGSFIKHGLSQVELESEIIIVLLAGSDTTATAVRTIMHYIVTNPRVYARLVEEITSTKPSTRPISNSKAQALPYLRAVIVGGLRMLMPLQGLASRNPPKGGIELGGVFVPEGTEIGIAWYSMLHRKDVFGNDADTFRPERWLEGDDIEAMGKVQELVFGSGRSSCLGRTIAQMELRKVIFELLSAFDIVLTDPMHPMTTRANGVLVQKNFNARAYVRRSVV